MFEAIWGQFGDNFGGEFFLTIVWTIEAISEATSAKIFASISTVID